jgi:hypothetical protein
MSGPAGPTGHTGITGRRGLQGTPYGPTGTTFYSPSGSVNVVSMQFGGVSIPGGAINSGTVYNIIQPLSDPLITFPLDLTSDHYGAFWTFTNTLGSSPQRIVILSGIQTLQISGTLLTRGIGQQIGLDIPLGQSITFVFTDGSGSSTSYIAF